MRLFLLLRTWIICAALAAASAYFVHQTVGVWTAEEGGEVKTAGQKAPAYRASRSAAYRPDQGYNVYQVIAQKDLFASDRREFLPEKPSVSAAVVAPPALDNRFALFGVMIDGPDKEALVSNLDRKNTRDKEYVWVRVGDSIGNLNVSDIQSGQIIVTQAGSSYIIRLSDQSHRLKRTGGRGAPKTTEPNTITIEKAGPKAPAENRAKTSS